MTSGTNLDLFLKQDFISELDKAFLEISEPRKFGDIVVLFEDSTPRTQPLLLA